MLKNGDDIYREDLINGTELKFNICPWLIGASDSKIWANENNEKYMGFLKMKTNLKNSQLFEGI